MTTFSEEEKDPQLVAMKESLKSSSVLKIAILTIRSQLDEIPIFVFEGPDDKAAYSQWIRRNSPGLAYEPLPANGKDQALKLWDSLIKDKDGLIAGIYIFVDRDFDDLKGRSPHQNLFMTERYAVENYVVCPYVLDEILKDELHCHAQPNLRRDVVNHFSQAYDSFLDIIKELNFTIYCARKLKIAIDSLPKKISKIASVNLGGVHPATPPCDTIVELERKITIDESAEHRELFDALDPSLRYRGKFLLLFFSKWIELLASERIHKTTPLMKTAGTITKVGASTFSIGSLASRSSFPDGLESFLSRIPPPFVQTPLLAEADTTAL
jgi:hypothetical protein